MPGMDGIQATKAIRALKCAMEVGKLAHKLKGQAANLGFRRLAAMASALEDAARQDEGDLSTYLLPLRTASDATRA